MTDSPRMLRRVAIPLHMLSLLVAACSADPIPKAWLGNWQVDAVLIDGGATRTLHYQHDDDRLKGRMVALGPGELTTDLPEDKRCGRPSVTSRRTTAGALIRDTMAHRGSAPVTPTPGDYELGLASSAPVEVWQIDCADGGMGPAGRENGTWIVALPGGKLAMRWYDETILRLTRVPENAKPSPSFDCAKATLPAEKAICASRSLAAFDRSVAASYSFVTRHLTELDDTDTLKRVQNSQRAWLQKRNTCAADPACLEKSMDSRVKFAFALSVITTPGDTTLQRILFLP